MRPVSLFIGQRLLSFLYNILRGRQYGGDRWFASSWLLEAAVQPGVRSWKWTSSGVFVLKWAIDSCYIHAGQWSMGGGGDDQNLNRQIFPTFHQTVKNFTSFCSDTSARSHRSVVASAALLPSVRLEAELERSAPQAVARMRSARRSLINVGAVQWLRNDVLQTDEGRLKFYASII